MPDNSPRFITNQQKLTQIFEQKFMHINTFVSVFFACSCAQHQNPFPTFPLKATQPRGAVVSLLRAAACQKEDFFPSVRGHKRAPG